MMETFLILIMVIILQGYTFVQTYYNIYFKYVQFVVCQLDLHKAVFKTRKEEGKGKKNMSRSRDRKGGGD